MTAWCQAENEALQQLVLEVAHNKQEAQRKVAGLKQKYSNLLAKVGLTHCVTLKIAYLKQKYSNVLARVGLIHSFM